MNWISTFKPKQTTWAETVEQDCHTQ